MTAMRALALLAGMAAVACDGDDSDPLVVDMGEEQRLSGLWSGTVGTLTVRYSLNDTDGLLDGRFEITVPTFLEGTGTVMGQRRGSHVTLNAEAAMVPHGYDAVIESGVVFIGTQGHSDFLNGEISFEGGDAPAGVDSQGRPIGVRLTPYQTPITLVRR